jgi:hypothetical protein
MRYSSKRKRVIGALSVGVLLLVGLTLTDFALSTPKTTSSASAGNAISSSASNSIQQQSSSLQSSVAAQNSVVYRDPATGKIIQTPRSAYPRKLAEQMKDALSASTDGLIEVQSPVSGTFVNLNGRFMNLMAASESAAGLLDIGCQSAGEGAVTDNKTLNPKNNIEE